MTKNNTYYIGDKVFYTSTSNGMRPYWVASRVVSGIVGDNIRGIVEYVINNENVPCDNVFGDRESAMVAAEDARRKRGQLIRHHIADNSLAVRGNEVTLIKIDDVYINPSYITSVFIEKHGADTLAILNMLDGSKAYASGSEIGRILNYFHATKENTSE